jgi:hypothetical protein
VLGIVVEVQLNRDDDKGFVWPVYIATLRNRIRCPVCLLVVASDAKVVNWARQPILLGGALAHGQDSDTKKAVQIALAAERVVAELDSERSELYFDLLRCCLSEAARQALEEMDPKKYQYQSEFARRYYGRGKEEGRTEGLVEGRAEMALTMLSKRFGSLPEMTQTRIRCATAAELNALADRLFSAHTLNEVLGALS